MDRRRFLTAMSVAGATGVIGHQALSGSGGGAVDATTASAVTPTTVQPTIAEIPTTTTTEAPRNGNKVLVVVQMNGGNDALNTLVPSDGRYHDLRPDIALAEADVLGLSDGSGLGLHPSLAPLLGRWNDGRLAAVAGVGYEDASRSHFAAMDDWFSATPGEANTTGWLGRWADLTLEPDASPMRLVSLGGRSAALDADESSAIVVNDPATFGLAVGDRTDLDGYEDLLRLLGGRQGAALDEGLDAAAALADITGSGGDDVIGGSRSFTSLLTTAAGLVEADLGTEIIVVSGGGFDTHAEQPATHAGLLDDVATGVAGFLDRIDELGRADDVLVLTTSEFGRRAAQNGSLGTDHGRAGVQFLAGSAVVGGVTGGWDLSTLVDGDLRPDVDTRALYRAALDWLGGPTTDVLGADFEDLGLIDA